MQDFRNSSALAMMRKLLSLSVTMTTFVSQPENEALNKKTFIEAYSFNFLGY